MDRSEAVLEMARCRVTQGQACVKCQARLVDDLARDRRNTVEAEIRPSMSRDALVLMRTVLAHHPTRAGQLDAPQPCPASRRVPRCVVMAGDWSASRCRPRAVHTDGAGGAPKTRGAKKPRTSRGEAAAALAEAAGSCTIEPGSEQQRLYTLDRLVAVNHGTDSQTMILADRHGRSRCRGRRTVNVEPLPSPSLCTATLPP